MSLSRCCNSGNDPGSDLRATYGFGIEYRKLAAVRIFNKSTAIQYASENIRANSVHPGFVDSPMTRAHHDNPNIHEERVAKMPLGRMGLPEDIAAGILYLASDESPFVTGAELVIYGGMTAQ